MSELRRMVERLIIENRNSLNDPTTNEPYDVKGIANDVVELIQSQQQKLLQEIFEQIAKSAIVTLDTDPVGIDKVKNIPVGEFVRLNDVRAVMQKFINDSQAVS